MDDVKTTSKAMKSVAMMFGLGFVAGLAFGSLPAKPLYRWTWIDAVFSHQFERMRDRKEKGGDPVGGFSLFRSRICVWRFRQAEKYGIMCAVYKTETE